MVPLPVVCVGKSGWRACVKQPCVLLVVCGWGGCVWSEGGRVGVKKWGVFVERRVLFVERRVLFVERKVCFLAKIGLENFTIRTLLVKLNF